MTDKQIIEYSLNAPKEAIDLGIAIQTVLEETAKALEDGFQILDIVKIVSGSMHNIVIAASELRALASEFKVEPVKCSQAIFNHTILGVETLIK